MVKQFVVYKFILEGDIDYALLLQILIILKFIF